MGLLGFLFPSGYFKIPSEKGQREYEKGIVKKIVMKLSRRNVYLSMGLYRTEEDKERMRKRKYRL